MLLKETDRPNDRLKVSVSTANEPLAWSIFCRSASARRKEGRKEGMEMRCVQNGRLERKEEREARITTGLSEGRGEGAGLYSCSGRLAKEKEEERRKEGDVDETATSCLPCSCDPICPKATRRRRLSNRLPYLRNWWCHAWKGGRMDGTWKDGGKELH